MPRVMTIWLPRWPVQRRFQEQPQWRAAPLFVCRRQPRGVMTVVSWWLPPAPGVARGLAPAIAAGMPLAEAMDGLARCRGVRACASAVIDPDDPVADRDALVALARWCRRFSPLVALESQAPAGGPECIQLDVGGTAGFFGGEERLVRLAAWTLTGRGFHARAAIADTPAASWAAAHHTAHLHARRPATSRRAVGQPASRVAVVPAGEAATVLAPLPASALRLDDGDLQRLAELGIDTLGGVLRLPRKELAARFGESLSRRMAEFGGARAEPLVCPDADELPQARHAWEGPVLLRDMPWEALERVVGRLVGECVAPLAASGHGVVALQVRLERPRWSGGRQIGAAGDAGAEGPTVIDVGLYRPTVAVEHLVDLVRLRMARAPLPREIDAIAVEVLAAGRATARQRRLFDGGADASHARVGMLLDRLSGRLGRRALFAPQPVADAQPEHAWMAAPPVVQDGGGDSARRAAVRGSRAAEPRGATESASGNASGSARGAPQRRPVWLLPRPQRLEVVSVVPDGPPVRVRRQAKWLDVARAQGAERIETAWWRGACVRRDYWIVETESGERFWIFRRLGDGAWFLHGLFA